MSKGIVIEDLSVLSDTNDLQLRAYNEAFVECGVPWEWESNMLASLSHIPDGNEKIGYFNEMNGGLEIHSPEFIHTAKNMFFERLLARNTLQINPGIKALLDFAQLHQVPVIIAAIEPPHIVHCVLESAKIPVHRFSSILTKTESYLP